MQRLQLGREFRLKGPARWETAIEPGGPLVGVIAYPIMNHQQGSMLDAGPQAAASSTQPGFAVSNALDGNLGTRWISHGTRPGQGPTESQPESLALTFAKPYTAAAVASICFGRSVPVVDGNGVLVGIVTEADFLRLTVRLLA